MRLYASDLDRVQQDALRKLSRAVFETRSRGELRQAFEGPVKDIMAATARDLGRVVDDAIRRMDRAAEAERRAFGGDFRRLYRNLAAVGGRVRAAAPGLGAEAAGAFTAGAAPAALTGEIAQLFQGAAWHAAGGASVGAGLGAALGAVVLPGLGAVVGGLLGGAFGLLFGPSLGDLQRRCWEQLEQAVVRGFAEFDAQARGHLGRAAAAIEARPAEVIGRHAREYDALVRQMIARDEAAAAALRQFRDQIERELEDIRSRQDQLSRTRTRLRSL